MILGFWASVDSITFWKACLGRASLPSLSLIISWTRPEMTQRVPSDLSLPWNWRYTACSLFSSGDCLSMLSVLPLCWCVSCWVSICVSNAYVSTLLVSSMSGLLNSFTLVSSFEVMLILLYAPSWLYDRWDGDLTLSEHWEDSFPLNLIARRSRFYLKSSWLLLAPSSISFDLLFYEPARSFRYYKSARNDLFKFNCPIFTIFLVKFLIPTFCVSSFGIFSWPMRFKILNSLVDLDFCEFMWTKELFLESLLWLLLVFDTYCTTYHTSLAIYTISLAITGAVGSVKSTIPNYSGSCSALFILIGFSFETLSMPWMAFTERNSGLTSTKYLPFSGLLLNVLVNICSWTPYKFKNGYELLGCLFCNSFISRLLSLSVNRL